MAADPDLLQAVTDALKDARAIGYTSSSNSSDVFEGFVWALVVAAAREQGAAVVYETVHGNASGTLTFRTAPGAIFSRAHPYTHASLSFAQRPVLEAHIGIKVVGRSRMLHECDVAVLLKSEADSCRRQKVHPRSSTVILAAECKFYSSQIPLYLGRSFLGLAGEIHKEHRYLVANTNSDSVVRVLTYHRLEWETDVTPTLKQADNLQKSFERVFRNYRVS